MKRSARAVIVLLALSLAGCEVLDGRTTDEYEDAMRAWNARNHRVAVERFLKLAKDHPYSPLADNALYWVGVTQFLYLGETEKALQTMRFVLKKYPRRDMASEAQFTIAQIYELGYRDHERAVKEFRRASEYANRSIREKSLYSLGDNLFQLGKADEARETWMRQAQEFPRGPQAPFAYYRLGTIAFAKGNLGEAERYYRRTLEADPDEDLTVKVKYALAGCLEAGEQLKAALALYKELLPVYPNPAALEIKIKALETRIQKKSY